MSMQDQRLAWDLYNTNPDFSITPRGAWDSLWYPQVEQYIQEQQNKAIEQRPDLMKSPAGRKKLQDFFNKESGDAQYLEELQRREELRQQRIQDAIKEGRVAQIMRGRNPAATITNEFYNHNDPSNDRQPRTKSMYELFNQKPVGEFDDYEDRSNWTPEDWANYRKQRKVVEMLRFGQ